MSSYKVAGIRSIQKKRNGHRFAAVDWENTTIPVTNLNCDKKIDAYRRRVQQQNIDSTFSVDFMALEKRGFDAEEAKEFLLEKLLKKAVEYSDVNVTIVSKSLLEVKFQGILKAGVLKHTVETLLLKHSWHIDFKIGGDGKGLLKVEPKTTDAPVALTFLPDSAIDFAPSAKLRELRISNPSDRFVSYVCCSNALSLIVLPSQGMISPKSDVVVQILRRNFIRTPRIAHSVSIEWTNVPRGAANTFRQTLFQRDGMVKRTNIAINYST